MGFALSAGDLTIFRQSPDTYLLNVAGIVIGSLIIFPLMGFYRSAKRVIKEVQEEAEG